MMVHLTGQSAIDAARRSRLVLLSVYRDPLDLDRRDSVDLRDAVAAVAADPATVHAAFTVGVGRAMALDVAVDAVDAGVAPEPDPNLDDPESLGAWLQVMLGALTIKAAPE